METIEPSKRSEVGWTLTKWALTISAMFVVLGVLAYAKYSQIQKGMAMHAAFQMPPEAASKRHSSWLGLHAGAAHICRVGAGVKTPKVR